MMTGNLHQHAFSCFCTYCCSVCAARILLKIQRRRHFHRQFQRSLSPGQDVFQGQHLSIFYEESSQKPYFASAFLTWVAELDYRLFFVFINQLASCLSAVSLQFPTRSLKNLYETSLSTCIGNSPHSYNHFTFLRVGDVNWSPETCINPFKAEERTLYFRLELQGSKTTVVWYLVFNRPVAMTRAKLSKWTRNRWNSLFSGSSLPSSQKEQTLSNFLQFFETSKSV